MKIYLDSLMKSRDRRESYRKHITNATKSGNKSLIARLTPAAEAAEAEYNAAATQIAEAIKTAEGRARERLLTVAELIAAVDTIEDKFSAVKKKNRGGMAVAVNVHAQRFPSGYKWTPESTWARLVWTRRGWCLINIGRGECTPARFRAEIPEAAADDILASYRSFYC